VAIHAAAGKAVVVLETVPAQAGQHVPARGQGQLVLQVTAITPAARAGAAPGQAGQVVIVPGAGAIHRIEQVDATHRAGAAREVGAVGGLRGEVRIQLVYVRTEQHLVFHRTGAYPPHRIGVGGERLVVADL